MRLKHECEKLSRAIRMMQFDGEISIEAAPATFKLYYNSQNRHKMTFIKADFQNAPILHFVIFS